MDKYNHLYTSLDKINEFKQQCSLYISQQLEIKENELIEDLEKNIILSDQEKQLIYDICLQILKNTGLGHNKLLFDFQYNNPYKDYYKPGPPKLILSEDGHAWLRNKGFITKNIMDCYNVSKTCDFACVCKSITKVLIKWTDINYINSENIDKFSSTFCNHISKLVQKY